MIRSQTIRFTSEARPMVNRVRFFSSKIHNYNVHIEMFICTFVRFLELRNQSIANSSGAFQNITGNNFRKNDKSTILQGWDGQIKSKHRKQFDSTQIGREAQKEKWGNHLRSCDLWRGRHCAHVHLALEGRGNREERRRRTLLRT